MLKRLKRLLFCCMLYFGNSCNFGGKMVFLRGDMVILEIIYPYKDEYERKGISMKKKNITLTTRNYGEIIV